MPTIQPFSISPLVRSTFTRRGSERFKGRDVAVQSILTMPDRERGSVAEIENNDNTQKGGSLTDSNGALKVVLARL